MSPSLSGDVESVAAAGDFERRTVKAIFAEHPADGEFFSDQKVPPASLRFQFINSSGGTSAQRLYVQRRPDVDAAYLADAVADFLYRDFRPLFRQGQEMARALGFYMQKYCGCIFSEEERYRKPKQIIP